MRREGPGLSRRAVLVGAARSIPAVPASSCRAPEAGRAPRSEGGRQATILLRSGWQTENIGDIAHTPGLLRLLQIHLGEAGVMVWSNALDRGVGAMLRRNFPKVRIVSGSTDDNGRPETAELAEAFERADFLLHGSGPGVVARSHLEAWRRTGKRYGIFGVTVALREEAASRALDARLRATLEGAAFVFTRETASLKNLQQAGILRPQLGFAPDSTFSLRIYDEAAAERFLKENGLEPKKFIAVVPRLRYTPYHTMRAVNWSKEEIARRTAVNRKHQEADHAKLREVITTWVRQTGHKALLCPEMTYQVGLLEPLLYRPLPDEVKAHVVRRDRYWLPDEAGSVYRRAAAVVSLECHSPIIAAANDTPCIYVHQPEDGIKGQMWRDVGLKDWYFEVESASGEEIAGRLMSIYEDYAAAQVRVHEAVIYARKLQGDAMSLLRRLVLG